MNGPNLSKREIRDYVSTTVDAIERATHRTIWRTSMRIHDIVIMDSPEWRENPFMYNKHAFLNMLMRFCFSDSITAIPGRDLYAIGEQYEESFYEPIFYEDITLFDSPQVKTAQGGEGKIFPYVPIDPRTVLTERYFYRFMQEGMNIDEANISTQSITPSELSTTISFLKKHGLSFENIFYKYPIGSSDKSTETLPEHPAFLHS